MTRPILLITLLAGFCFGQAATQPTPKQVVPFDGIVESTITSNVGDKTPHVTTEHIYRDAQGRTRREQGDSVFISDPVMGTSFVLNTKTKTARQRTSRSSASNLQKQPQVQPSSTAARPSNAIKPQITQENLGTSVIDGHDVVGQRITTQIPPMVAGNLFRIKVTDEIWTSKELGVPIMTSSSDPRQTTTVVRLRTILTYPQLDASLFQVPTDFKLVTSTPVIKLQSKQAHLIAE